jgi:uncharacterized protein YllA (UPF0747 family)
MNWQIFYLKTMLHHKNDSINGKKEEYLNRTIHKEIEEKFHLEIRKGKEL